MFLGCSEYRQMTRRDFFRAGGAGLFGMTMSDFFQARANAAGKRGSKAKQMILIWMAGGPPHQDMFDMKPDTPPPYGSELKPAKTKVPGIEFCSLMPRLANNADKFSILRSVGIGNEKWEHSGGLYWLCGNPRTKDTPKFPMYGSVVAHERPAQRGVPTFVAFGHYHDAGDAAGDLRNNYLGPAYDPLIFKPGDAKNEVGAMLAPPAHLDLSGLAKREKLLASLDQQLRKLDAAEPVIAGLDRYQQSAFDLLRSPKLRDAVDPKKLNPKDIERYGKNEQGTMALYAADDRGGRAFRLRSLARLGYAREHYRKLQESPAEGRRPAGQPAGGSPRTRSSGKHDRHRPRRDGPQQNLEGSGLLRPSRAQSLGHDAVRAGGGRRIQERHDPGQDRQDFAACHR